MSELALEERTLFIYSSGGAVHPHLGDRTARGALAGCCVRTVGDWQRVASEDAVWEATAPSVKPTSA